MCYFACPKKCKCRSKREAQRPRNTTLGNKVEVDNATLLPQPHSPVYLLYPFSYILIACLRRNAIYLYTLP